MKQIHLCQYENNNTITLAFNNEYPKIMQVFRV